MKKYYQFLTMLCFLSMFFIITADAQQQPFTATDLLKLEYPVSPVISPDAKQVAFTIRKPDLQASQWITQVYVVSVADKSIRQMTASASSCSSPVWSPDGKWLTFVSKRDFLNEKLQKQSGTSQIFVLPMGGGEALPLTNLSNDIEEYTWSPDGTKIAILAEEELSSEKQAEVERKVKLKMDWTSSLDPKLGKDLWVLDVVLKTAKKIKTLDPGVTNLAWSPDSKKLVYQTDYTGEYNDEQKFDILEDRPRRNSDTTDNDGRS